LHYSVPGASQDPRRQLVRQPGVKLKYVVDVDATAATALAHQHGAQTTSAETVFADAALPQS